MDQTTILQRMTSRKFLISLAFVLVVFLNKMLDVGLTEDEIQQVMVVVLGYLGVEGTKDAITEYQSK